MIIILRSFRAVFTHWSQWSLKRKVKIINLILQINRGMRQLLPDHTVCHWQSWWKIAGYWCSFTSVLLPQNNIAFLKWNPSEGRKHQSYLLHWKRSGINRPAYCPALFSPDLKWLFIALILPSYAYGFCLCSQEYRDSARGVSAILHSFLSHPFDENSRRESEAH